VAKTPHIDMVLDKRYKYSYNRNKLASKVSVTVVKIQQKRYPKHVDRGVERRYNRD
jgi:hypothetical protein